MIYAPGLVAQPVGEAAHGEPVAKPATRPVFFIFDKEVGIGKKLGYMQYGVILIFVSTDK